MALSMDSILKLSKAKKILILAVILCVIAGLYLYVFFIPGQDELTVAKGELGKLAKELTVSKDIARDLEKFKAQVEKLNAELKNALTQLPNEKEIPELLKNISSLGRESSLEFTLFRPRPEVPQQFYAQVPIEMVALGSYHNVGLFFDRVSKLPRIINVVGFNMTRPKDLKGKTENEILVRTACTIHTYRFIETKSEEKKSEEKKSSPTGTGREGMSKTGKK